MSDSGSKDDKPTSAVQPTRLNDMIAGRPNRSVGLVPGRKRRTESGEEDVETGEEVPLETEHEGVRTNGIYQNASPFAAFAPKPADTTVAGPQGDTKKDRS